MCVLPLYVSADRQLQLYCSYTELFADQQSMAWSAQLSMLSDVFSVYLCFNSCDRKQSRDRTQREHSLKILHLFAHCCWCNHFKHWNNHLIISFTALFSLLYLCVDRPLLFFLAFFSYNAPRQEYNKFLSSVQARWNLRSFLCKVLDSNRSIWLKLGKKTTISTMLLFFFFFFTFIHPNTTMSKTHHEWNDLHFFKLKLKINQDTCTQGGKLNTSP